MKKIKLLLISILLLWASVASAQLSSTTFVQTYTCNGSSTAYTFPFYIYSSTGISVTVNTAGTVTTLTQPVNYTVAPSSYFPYNFTSGGTVNLSAGGVCPLNSTLTITRVTPQTQLTVYSNNQSFDQTILESDLNKVYMCIQEIAPATGTFTPTIAFGGGNTGLTYTTQSGYYTKTGNRVYYDIVITLSAVGSSVGAAVISGLPYTSITKSVIGIFPQSVSWSGYIGGYVSGATIILDQVSTAGVVTTLTNSNFSGTSTLYISGVYETAN